MTFTINEIKSRGGKVLTLTKKETRDKCSSTDFTFVELLSSEVLSEEGDNYSNIYIAGEGYYPMEYEDDQGVAQELSLEVTFEVAVTISDVGALSGSIEDLQTHWAEVEVDYIPEPFSGLRDLLQYRPELILDIEAGLLSELKASYTFEFK